MLFQCHSRSLTAWAPAKLNLFLEVLGKRADGYHELETLMVSIGLYDTVRFSEAPPGFVELHCSFAGGPRALDARTAEPIPAGPDNLIVKAAELLRTATGTEAGVRIELTKRIPMAAGLAGGSSDAAVTLAGLNRFWKLGLSTSRLQELAAQLGSDVAFFLSPAAAAVCRGRGEQVEPCDFPLDLHFVIVRPATGLATATVFRHCRPAEQRESVQPLLEALRHGRLGRVASLLHNRLQAPAEALNADVTRLKQHFSKLPVLGHLMSGSGTSYFGLCANRQQGLRVAARLKAVRAGEVFVARSRP